MRASNAWLLIGWLVAEAGRPTIFSEAVADEICTRLANGESLRSICAEDREDHVPAMGTVLRWVVENEIFREHYVRAREIQAETLADDIVTIADGTSDGDVQRDRLRVDARKWVASKILPKKYGDKVAHVGGGPDDAPIRTETKLDTTALTDEQLRALASIRVG